MPDMKVKMGVPMMIITLIILLAIAYGLHYLGVGKQPVVPTSIETSNDIQPQ